MYHPLRVNASRKLLSLLHILLNSTTPAGALGLCTVGNLAVLP